MIVSYDTTSKLPFQTTNKILELLQDISYELSILAGSKLSACKTWQE